MPYIVRGKFLDLIDPNTGAIVKSFDLCSTTITTNRNGDIQVRDNIGSSKKLPANQWLLQYGLDLATLQTEQEAADCGGGGSVVADPNAITDVELTCASTDGRKIILRLLGDGSTELTELDGTAIGDGATAVSCDVDDKDIETIETCFQLIANPAVQFRRITFINTSTLITEATIWFDSVDITSPPDGATIQPCSSDVESAFVGKFIQKVIPSNGELQRKDFQTGITSINAAQVDADIVLGDSMITAGAVLDAFDFTQTPDAESTQLTLNVADGLVGVGTPANITEVTGFISSVGAGSFIQYQTDNHAAVRVYLGVNCGEEVMVGEVARGTGGVLSGRTQAILIPQGTHSIRVVTYDYDGANGIWTVRSSATNTGFSAGLQPNQFFSGETEERCFVGKQIEGSTDVLDFITGDVVPGTLVCGKTEIEISASCKQELIDGITEVVDLTKTHERTSGANTYTAPYRSLTITAISNDVVIDGQAIPRGMSVSVDSNENERIINDTIVDGSDYFVTQVI